jgi:diguanylate cyclase (GGDEF)-like protein
VRWGGDPNKAVSPGAEPGRLSPRTSFDAWTEEVRGQSKPWTATDIELAEEFRRSITDALLWHAELKLAQLSAFDPLTALANRRTVESEMDRCARAGVHGKAALLFFDLDRFKVINDSLGHLAGDHVLVQVAARLARLSPPGAVAARVGGDEFVLFWPGAGAAEAHALGERLLHAMADPVDVQGQLLRVTASIGIACRDVDALDRLMHEADEAMYAAKRRGGAAILAFQPSLHERVLDAMRLEQDLFQALESDELDVHFQPIVASEGGLALGFEALARWRHRTHGWIPPQDFIPIAEQSGLIRQVGAHVMARALHQVAHWRSRDAGLWVAINASVRQLADEALGDLLAALLATNCLPADCVHLEVTESVLMDPPAVRQLHRLRALGVRIAIDDFGTGYSSLAYLQDLPIDIVKIDRSFVTGLGSNPKARGLFQAIVSLARTLGLQTIAEGCETGEQFQIMREAGCDAVQGWFTGRPMPGANVLDFLESRRHGA